MIANSGTKTAITPDSSNSSNSSTLFDRSKECCNLNSYCSYESTNQFSPSTIPQQNSQHFMQVLVNSI